MRFNQYVINEFRIIAKLLKTLVNTYTTTCDNAHQVKHTLFRSKQ